LLREERYFIAALAEPRPDWAQAALWQLWFDEEGHYARELIDEAAQALDDPLTAGEAPRLSELMTTFPEWAEPVNRFATLRFLQQRFDESVELCEREWPRVSQARQRRMPLTLDTCAFDTLARVAGVLQLKPWHFGALSGIVMCHVKLDNLGEAKAWAAKAMPEEGSSERGEWVAGMLQIIDGRLAELDNVDHDD
jgi:hypothetical protein